MLCDVMQVAGDTYGCTCLWLPVVVNNQLLKQTRLFSDATLTLLHILPDYNLRNISESYLPERPHLKIVLMAHFSADIDLLQRF